MTVRQIALSLLDEYELGGKYVNLSLNSHLTDSLTGEERGFLTALVYTSVERKITYDYYVSSISKRSSDDIDLHTLNILRLGMCQLLAMDNIPDFAAVNETVSLGRHKGERSFVNGVLRRAERLKREGGLPLPERKKNEARYLSVYYSFPLSLVKYFISLFGKEETERLLSSFNTESYTDLRVNTQLITKEELISLLKEAGTEARPSHVSRYGIRISGSVRPDRLPGFKEGYFFVQDGICSLSSELLDIEKGDRIIDVCACPGGKSFAAAMLTGEEGEVLSLDLHESKLSLIEKGRDRLGLKNIRVGCSDATAPDASLFGSFDRVICDVPCSGLGVLGKKADMRYKELSSIDSLPELQYSILKSSSEYLKRGGILIYSTCTLNPLENEGVVGRFLEENTDFSPVDFESGEIKSEGGVFTAYPHIHKTDGFFIAKLRKN